VTGTSGRDDVTVTLRLPPNAAHVRTIAPTFSASATPSRATIRGFGADASSSSFGAVLSMTSHASAYFVA